MWFCSYSLFPLMSRDDFDFEFWMTLCHHDSTIPHSPPLFIYYIKYICILCGFRISSMYFNDDVKVTIKYSIRISTQEKFHIYSFLTLFLRKTFYGHEHTLLNIAHFYIQAISNDYIRTLIRNYSNKNTRHWEINCFLSICDVDIVAQECISTDNPQISSSEYIISSICCKNNFLIVSCQMFFGINKLYK